MAYVVGKPNLRSQLGHRSSFLFGDDIFELFPKAIRQLRT